MADKGYVSCYLVKESPEPIEIQYTLKVVNQWNSNNHQTFSHAIIMCDDESSSGRHNFIERSVLTNPSAGYCVNDTVIFRVEMTTTSHDDIHDTFSPTPEPKNASEDTDDEDMNVYPVDCIIM